MILLSPALMDKSDFREQRMRIILYRKGSPTNKCIAKNSAGIYKDRADVMQPRSSDLHGAFILQSAQALSDAFTAYKYFSPLALHLHNIRTVIVYTCIIAYVTISMFKIGFSQKGWTFSPRVLPDFFQARLFLFWINSDVGGFADDRNTSALTQ